MQPLLSIPSLSFPTCPLCLPAAERGPGNTLGVSELRSRGRAPHSCCKWGPGLEARIGAQRGAVGPPAWSWLCRQVRWEGGACWSTFCLPVQPQARSRQWRPKPGACPSSSAVASGCCLQALPTVDHGWALFHPSHCPHFADEGCGGQSSRWPA